MDDWAIYLLLVGGLLASLFLALLQLPGLWLMLLVTGGYIWATGAEHMGVIPLFVMLMIAIVAEVVETLAAAHGARRAGAGKTAMFLSVVGAVVGGIFLSFIIPVPVLGTLVGVCLGAFMGAAAGEAIRGRDTNQSIKSGVGAVIGRLFGTVAKLSLGSIMLLIAVVAAFPSGSGARPRVAAPVPASAPAQSAPATSEPTTFQVER